LGGAGQRLESQQEYKKAFELWKEQTGGEPAHRDPGRQPFTADWAKTDFSDGDWPVAQLPGAWETWLPWTDGVVWFRKAVDLPSRWQGKDLSLHLGPIDDLDTSFFNGVEVGRTGLETPNAWLTHRIYSIPAGWVRSGSNTLAVRVMNTVEAADSADRGRPVRLPRRFARGSDSTGGECTIRSP
jgi:sialate O-acetylesterase